MNFLEKIFRDDKVFNAIAIINVCLIFVSMVILFYFNDLNGTILMFILFLSSVFIFYFYKTHNKNGMKLLISLFLGIIISYDIHIVSFDDITSSILKVDYICIIIDFIFIINHMLINISHKSRSKNILINKVLVVIEIIITVVFSFVSYSTFIDIIGMISYVFMFLLVVCIELRIDAYKVIRDEKEEAGIWDEKAKIAAKKQIFGK